ncbi:serine hydrolase domain-containing protein [Acerihabitans sp. KWT182]|uniref:Serine hydrolase domain-containing protein n=1 Tax=Acerihabitans sp. KWT182 TaxID=3157919 RepID=A0AAU7QEH8_9GAMM
MNPLADNIESAADSVLGGLQRPGMPGLSVGVLQGDRVLLRKGYGLADIRTQRPNGPDVPMRIASLSKQFTVTLALMLEAEGRLSIDDPVRRYIPALPDYGVPVTLRDLMSNQSGVRDFLEMRLLSGGNFRDPVEDGESLELVCASAELNFRPGARFAYSNSGFMLLTRVVETLENDRLENILERRILAPLGMTQTRLARRDAPLAVRTGGALRGGGRHTHAGALVDTAGRRRGHDLHGGRSAEMGALCGLPRRAPCRAVQSHGAGASVRGRHAVPLWTGFHRYELPWFVLFWTSWTVARRLCRNRLVSGNGYGVGAVGQHH